MGVAELKTRTVKDLAAMAKRKGVVGWHAMRKEELVQALLKCFKSRASQGTKSRSNGKNAAGPAPGRQSGGNGPAAAKKAPNGQQATHGAKKSAKAPAGDGRGPATQKSRSGRAERGLDQIRAKLAQSKDLSLRFSCEDGAEPKDRLVLMVRDPYWLHAYWELSRQSVERARAALGQHWHGAKPVLRLVEVVRDGTTSSVRKIIRDIEIHGGVNNWYVDVDDPPRSFQLEIGYLALDRRFVSLARSNVVSTPPVGAVKSFDGNWAEVAEDYDRIYALSGGYSDEANRSELRDLFEERLRRPMRSPLAGRFGVPAPRGGGREGFCFELDTELVVSGVTSPDAQVTLKGEPVRLQPDGTFSVRFNLPERRQVFPVVASSGDGVEQRTIVLAVERNTKVMEPVIREPEP
ncbi:MAG: DUF4912 domain-containing protein [Thermoguttaceae bacterium]